MPDVAEVPDETRPVPPTEDELRAGTVDLLGAIAYGALTAFERSRRTLPEPRLSRTR